MSEIDLFNAQSEKDIAECLMRGDDINGYRDGKTPLAHHCKNNNIEQVIALIKNGCDISLLIGDSEISQQLGLVPLHLVCRYGYTELLVAMLQWENVRNSLNVKYHFYNFLTESCLNGHTDIFDVLIKYGADPNMLIFNDLTILMAACKIKSIDIVDRLLSLNLDVNVQDRQKRTALFHCREPSLIHKLYVHGANFNIQNEDGNTALMDYISFTSRNGYNIDLSIIENLICYTSEIDIRNNDGKTALIISTNYGLLEIVKLLLNAHANISIIDNDNKTALDYAREKSKEAIYENMLALLLEYY